MKNYLKTYLSVVIMLSAFLVIGLKPMQRTLQSPAGRALVAKRLSIARLQQAKQLKKPIWVRTKDGELFAIDEWQINEMDKLKTLMNNQKALNSQHDPIDAPELTKADLTLLVTAFNKIASGQFEQYYAELQPEYEKSLTDKTIGEGVLRTLITAAGKAEAKTLSAFLASYFLPNDMQKYLMVPQIIDPVVTYLNNEILKKNKLYPTTLAGHEGFVTSCFFSKNGETVATSALGKQNNLILWSAQTGNRLQTFSVDEGEIKDLATNHDSSKIVTIIKKHFEMPNFFDNDIQSTESKSTLALWDSKTGSLIKNITNIPGTLINQIEFSSNGQTIVAAIGNTKKITDNNPNQQEEKSYIMVISSIDGAIMATHEIKNDSPSFEINPNGNTFIAQSGIDLVLYDTATGKAIKKLDGPTVEIYDAKYNTHGTTIVAYDWQAHTIFIWNAYKGEQQAIFNNITDSRMAISPDGTKLATIDFSGIITIWDVAQHNQLTSIESGSISITAPTFSPDNNILAVNDTHTDTITFWNSITGEKIKSFPNQHPRNSFIDITFNISGTRMQSHSGPPQDEEKCTVKLWETATGKQIHSFVCKHKLFCMDEDFATIVSPDNTNGRNFILWKSFNKQEEDTLVRIKHNLNVVQAQILYQLYMAKLNNEYTSLLDIEKYKKELPADVQSMVALYLHAVIPKVNIPRPSVLSIPTQTIDITATQKPMTSPKIETLPARKPQSWGEWIISGDWLKGLR